jgi:hypothetical protein
MSHLIFSVLFIAAIICLVLYLGRKSHRCRWCRKQTVKVEDLPEADRATAHGIIFKERMGPSDLSSYDVCPGCHRIFDFRWFNDDRPLRRDWDMHDRRCACGNDLKRPSYELFSAERIREAGWRVRLESAALIRSRGQIREVPS